MANRFFIPIALILTPILASCAVGGNGPRGINPVLNATDVQTSADNTSLILNALARDNAVDISQPGNWYAVAESGFNYVDDQCRTYFDNLFFLNRDRELVKSSISAVGQTTSAILGVTQASSVTLAIVAQAFGLGVAGTDLIAGSFLYQLPPSTTYGFVRQMQEAYRDGIALKRAALNTPSAAYHAIQGYIDLCLPPTIEAKLVEHVSTAQLTPDVRHAGSDVSLSVSSKNKFVPTKFVPSVVVPPARARFVAPLPSPSTRLPKPEPPPPNPEAINSFEKRLPIEKVKQIQAALCQASTGHLDDSTRQAVVAFFSGAGQDRSDIVTKGISPRDMSLLDNAIQEVRDCKKQGFENAKSVGKSFLGSQ